MRMKSNDHPWCLCAYSTVLIGRLGGVTSPHPISTEIDDHMLKLHVLAVTRFPNAFHTESEFKAGTMAAHTLNSENNYINSLAESCRHRVKLFAIFLNLHILAAMLVC